MDAFQATKQGGAVSLVVDNITQLCVRDKQVCVCESADSREAKCTQRVLLLLYCC